MSIGVLTAGGDCPGLNAAIRAVVVRLEAEQVDVIGFENGWQGLMECKYRHLARDDVRGTLFKGGTILGTSRTDPYVHGDGCEAVLETAERLGLDRLIVIGGDGSLRSAARLQSDGLDIIGIPKTIDNDIGGTDVSIGFYTAVQIVTDGIDRLTTTAEAHNRIMVVEVMGRTTGWIANYAGVAGGAEAILVPEVEYDLHELAGRLRRRHEAGPNYSVVVVAEGIPDPTGQDAFSGTDAFGFPRHGGVAHTIASDLEVLTGYEARVMTLGYLQRGGTPSAFDRVLATRFGVKAAELAIANQAGVMVALRGDDIVTVDLAQACAEPRPLPRSRERLASWFFA